MKHAFVVTSSIEIDPSKNFKGVTKRTVFSTKERLDQTIGTLLNISEKDPTATIYLIDSSKSYFVELDNLQLKNFHYVRLEQLNSIIANRVRTHTSKSHCECLMILEFLKNYKKELRNYDFITKICARYILKENFSIDQFKIWK